MKFNPWYAQQGEMPGPDGKPIRRLTAEDIAKARKLMFPNKAAVIAYYTRLGLLAAPQQNAQKLPPPSGGGQISQENDHG